MSTREMWQIEDGCAKRGYKMICGVDEAGRGPLAGPVCAAAVILPAELPFDGLNDSKKLSDKKRRELFPLIKQYAVSYCVVLVDEKEIDRINILQATLQAMRRCVEGLSQKPDYVLVDGNKLPELDVEAEAIVHGDSLSASIAAASVLAKVTRDELMEKMAEEYPEYAFEVHKGYGTKAHYEALRAHGPSPIHRMTFLKKFYGNG